MHIPAGDLRAGDRLASGHLVTTLHHTEGRVVCQLVGYDVCRVAIEETVDVDVLTRWPAWSERSERTSGPALRTAVDGVFAVMVDRSAEELPEPTRLRRRTETVETHL